MLDGRYFMLILSPLFRLPVGMQNIVILNDWNSIKDSLKKDSFLGKARLFLLR